MSRITVTQQHIAAPSGHIDFCDVGSGLPVLYFHGTGAGNDAALLLERDLVDANFRLIVPNRPGYFNTSLGMRGSTDYCANLMAELLDYLKLRRVAIIATSGGGMPAASFAREYPDRAAALILQCAQSHRWDDGRWLPKGLERTLTLFRHRFFCPFLRWYNWLHARSLQRNPTACIQKMSGSRLRHVEEDATTKHQIARLAAMTFACAAQPRGIENDWAILVGDNSIRAGSIHCPTLIIHDREDPLVPFLHAEWSHACIADSRLLEICAGGHLIWFGPDSAKMKRNRIEFIRTHLSTAS